MVNRLHLVALLLSIPYFTHAQYQFTNHWETIVCDSDIVRFFPGNWEPDNNWFMPGFDDSQWQIGQGGIGFGDEDDSTTIPITNSVYIRIPFQIIDVSKISYYLFSIDYDDGYVAYLNGKEIARNNVKPLPQKVLFNDTALKAREAKMYQELQPEYRLFSAQDWNSLVKNGTNVLAVQVHNANDPDPDLTARIGLAAGINTSQIFYRPIPAWFEWNNLFFKSNMPLVFINTDKVTIPDEPKIDGYIKIAANSEGYYNYVINNPTEFEGWIGIEQRGNSSKEFPKKSYGFETRKPDGSNRNHKLLGMPEDNDWILYGPYNDKSLLRNQFGYWAFGRMGHYAVRTRFCELFLNDKYRGVYQLIEKPKPGLARVNIARMTPGDTIPERITGGYMLEIDRPNENPGPLGWTSGRTSITYLYTYPDYQVITEPQKNYIRTYVSDFERAVDQIVKTGDVNSYKQYVDLTSFADYFLLNELSNNIDGMRYSTKMYKDREGKLTLGPAWDYDISFGNHTNTSAYVTDVWRYETSIQMFNADFGWYNMLYDQQYKNLIASRWNQFRNSFLHTDSVMQYIDMQAGYLKQAQQRNFEKWEILGQYVWPNWFIGLTYDEETTYLKTWLEARMNWLDQHMFEIKTPVPFIRINPVKIFPNPVVDQCYVQYSAPITSLAVFDVSGRKVSAPTTIKNTENQTIDFSLLPSGVYFVKVHSDRGIFTQKVLKK